MECRPIRREEAEEFLSLLCLCFHLDSAHARAVFYNDPNLDLGTKWAAFESGRIVSIATTSSLEFGWGNAVGIAGVATVPTRQGEGFARCLLEKILIEASLPALLFAHRIKLYRSLGFEVVDEVVRGTIRESDFQLAPAALTKPEVRACYEVWSDASPNRLRRTDEKWRSWEWNFKACEPVGEGYICMEPMLCREAILTTPLTEWPVAPAAEWVGIKTLTEELAVPIRNMQKDMLVMARNFPAPPSLFMTDQF